MQVTQPDNSTVNYVYDAAGNRVRSVDSGGTTNYVVDPTTKTPQVMVETDGSGHIVASYTYGLGLISQRRNGVDSFYISDALGSTRALTNSQGVVTDRYTYDAFGQLTSSTGTTVNSFLYTGEQKDEAAGMYYLRARYYDPAVGRFLTSDPHEGSLQSPQSLNKYAYVENDPVNMTDPRGLYSAWQGSKIHQEIGRYYIERHGDYFVDELGYPPNRGFPPGTGGGLGAYNRNIRSGFAFRLYVDLRHYGLNEVYEIKPLTDTGVASAILESRAYTAVLNHFESDAGEWSLGERTYPAWRVWLSPYSSTKTIQTFASPLAPAGALIYTDNVVRDLSDSKVIKAADRLGYALVKRLQAIAPKLIQDSGRADAVVTKERFDLAPVLKF
jgi:RHS repeat-associated protein